MKQLWEQVSFVMSSKYRKAVLEAIENPITPTQLKKKLNIDKAHISRALDSLVKSKLAICLTPNAKKFKLYKISESGNKVLQQLNKLEIR